MSTDKTTDPTAFWTGRCSLYWRTDCFGHEGRSLCVGALEVGSIGCFPRVPTKGGFVGNEKPWRGWLDTDTDGKCIGWFLTEREAKDALEDAALKELLR